MSAAESPASPASTAGAQRQAPRTGILWINVRNCAGRTAARDAHRLVRSVIGSRRTTAKFNRLHHRLLAVGHGPRAGIEAELAALLRPKLVAQLRGWCGPCIDRDDLIDMAVDDALRKYFEHPERYVPGRGETVAWFVKVAQNRFRDALRRQRRRLAVERPAGVDAASSGRFLKWPCVRVRTRRRGMRARLSWSSA